ncbi:heat-inducible transcriptional repressor HrcA, partial [Chloroflexota bacterium]
MITTRKGNILKVIVGEYIANGVPVSSKAISARGLGVSSATIRNDMIELEEEGYLTQPHTSAGRIPSDQGYRYYIKSLMGDVYLSPEEQRLIRHQFHQVKDDLEEWIRLAAAILSTAIHGVALVTFPKDVKSRLKHLELVFINDHLILLVMVMWEAKLKQHLLSLEEGASQEGLSAIARKLTSNYGGLSTSEIAARSVELSSLEGEVMRTVVQLMKAEEVEEYEEPYVEGLRHIIDEPDFSWSGTTAAIMEVFEQKGLLRAFLPQVVSGEGLQV